MFNHRDRRRQVAPASTRCGGRRRGADTDTSDVATPGPRLRLRAILRVDVTYSILILCAILEIFLDTRYRVSM